MQNVAIIDADIIGRKKHRFPNLASMKLSAWHKNNNDNVTLEWSYDNVNNYDYEYGYIQFSYNPITKKINSFMIDVRVDPSYYQY